MAPYAAPARSSFWQKLGPGGLVSFSLAVASVVLLAFLPLVVRLVQVIWQSRRESAGSADGILILGRKLEGDQPTPVFLARLAHGEALWRSGRAPRILIAGGLTGQATLSEAAAGRLWLVARGVPEAAILLEDQSQHTLENLFFVRETLRSRQEFTLLLVSDPLHLVRATALARGLGMQVFPAPAKGCPPRRWTPAWWLRACLEAFFLHWYRTGLGTSRLIGAHRQLDRVT